MVNTRSRPFHGILLYRQNYREHDMLVKFFTAEAGKKMFFIRGARRSKFKMTADILPFSYGTYDGSLKKQGLSYISAAKQVKHFTQISDDLMLNAYATYVMGLVDAAFSDGVAAPHWFDQLFYALNLINNGFDPAIITNIMEVQLLPVFGIAPQLKRCAVCGRKAHTYDYSEQLGGLICERHFADDPHRLHLEPRTIYYLQLFSVVDLQKIGKINVNQRTKQQLQQVLDQLYDNEVGLNLKSKKFLRQMKHWSVGTSGSR
ncbi:DNA repair protein RecO [Fructilactobacillus cliffordii]|uniref:DNA repair protein RecO n=1 Tax=Fructilactobacillus cliffordii TaxID=2940299 RepID=UPI0020936EA2|nr:DNA repair protein RecO [Fructilactobacillus cliffordii]USS86601.1 DNA repair protein RecO [Fructilactobacillus cliffordii]